jgi:GMP reductase
MFEEQVVPHFDYKDINLVPKYSEVDSRSECDTSIAFGNRTFKLPIVPANMRATINEALAEKLAREDYFYILHRFDVDVISFIKTMNKKKLFTSISIGVNQDSYELLYKIIKEKLDVDYITVDIAHGHCVKMKLMLEFLKRQFPSSFLIAGNVSTIEATRDLISWGASCIKVGIGNGSACTTYPSTGFGSRGCQASTVHDCAIIAWEEFKVPVIADGGISEPADITKSLVLGAKMVMIGGMLSGFFDSPGDIYMDVDNTSIPITKWRADTLYPENLYKQFFGSASSLNKGHNKHVEGKVMKVPFKNQSILDYYKYLQECLQSSISYGGGKNLVSLTKVNYIIKN